MDCNSQSVVLRMGMCIQEYTKSFNLKGENVAHYSWQDGDIKSYIHLGLSGSLFQLERELERILQCTCVSTNPHPDVFHRRLSLLSQITEECS